VCSHYELFRVNAPDFPAILFSDLIVTTTDTEYIDTTAGIIGDPDVQHFYAVVAVDTAGNKGELQTRVGEYDYALYKQPGGSNRNHVGIPLDIGISKASEFIALNPDIASLTYYDPIRQAFLTAIPITPFVDNFFTLEMGKVYYPNVSQDTTLTFVGRVMEPLQPYNLVKIKTDKGTNPIMIPLDRSDITNASELWAVLPQSKVSLYEWDAKTQSEKFYVPEDLSTNFEVKPGGAYVVEVSETVLWDPYFLK